MVGGGLTGLSAAYELSNKLEEVEILLLEKKQKLGGRVQAPLVNGERVDFGGFIIYPWYRRYRKLVKELGLSDQLRDLPDLKIYGAWEDIRKPQPDKHIKMDSWDIVKYLIKTFRKTMTDLDPTDPKLDHYKEMTIEEYIKSLKFKPEKERQYLGVMDTFLQGFCYDSVSRLKMAFMSATWGRNVISGDAHDSSYFPQGSEVFIKAMEEELERRGVKILKGEKLEGIDGHKLVTTSQSFEPDHVLFAQTVSKKIYEQLHLQLVKNWEYTTFITAAVEMSDVPEIAGDSHWGASFYHDRDDDDLVILSTINLKELYGKKLEKFLTLNIKVHDGLPSKIDQEKLLKTLATQLKNIFPDVKFKKLETYIAWNKTMPTAHEEFVRTLKENQGPFFYFSGDFMGCPSMETALMTGYRAALKLLEDNYK